jgi:hypothetical protein
MQEPIVEYALVRVVLGTTAPGKSNNAAIPLSQHSSLLSVAIG